MTVLSQIKTFPVLGNFSEEIVTESSFGITVAKEVLLNVLPLIVIFWPESESGALSSESFPHPCKSKSGMERAKAANAKLKFLFMSTIIA